MSEHLLIGLVSIITIGVFAQWLAWRLKLPAILLLLIFGITAGPVTGLIDPDALLGDILGPVVSVSVAVILFEGGLSLRLSELKEIGNIVGKLISIGIIITWGLSTFFAYYLLDIGFEISVLFGAILIVTGPTVIIPLLRQVRPTGKVGSILKWEGIVNDPIGAMMAVLVFELMLSGGFTLTSKTALLSIVNTIAFGTFFGLLGALIIFFMLKRHLIPDFLQNPISLVLVFTVFGISNLLQHESGLLAVTVMGIALANQKSVRVKHIVDFKENLRVLFISGLFVLLAARLQVSHLEQFNWYAVGFLAALFFVVRPASIFISTIGSNINIKERLFLSWMAPRGIVAAAISAIFALRLTEEGYETAELLVPYTFIVIIGTVTIYGLSANWVARMLNVAKPVPKGVLMLGAKEWVRRIAHPIKERGFKVLMADTNWDNIAKAREEGFNTYYGSVLTEYAMDEINLDGVGRLLALTPNDEVNSLSVIRFAEVFGSSEVYQLAPVTKSRRKEREVPDYLSGRILFDEDLNYSEIQRYFEEGSTIEVEELTEEMDYKEFREKHGEYAIPLFEITEDESLKVFSVDNPPVPTAGSEIVFLKVPNDSIEEEPDMPKMIEEEDSSTEHGGEKETSKESEAAEANS